MLVVLKEPGELSLRHFLLVTDWAEGQIPGEGRLEFYYERATAKGHIGALKSVPRPALPTTNRERSHPPGSCPRKRRPDPRDAYACNEANLLFYALTCNFANTARQVLARASREPRALHRCRDALLPVAGIVILSARRVTVVILEVVAPLWSAFRQPLHRLFPTGPPLTA